jgi:hypothetical protein
MDVSGALKKHMKAHKTFSILRAVGQSGLRSVRAVGSNWVGILTVALISCPLNNTTSYLQFT